MPRRGLYGYKADGTPLRSQWETVLYYLQTNPGSSITSWQAIRDFGFTRLAAIVKLIEERTNIRLSREDEELVTRYGASTQITRYWYQEGDYLGPRTERDSL